MMLFCCGSHKTILSLLTIATGLITAASQSCIADATIESILAEANGFASGTIFPTEGSCCQSDMCGLPCPESVDPPTIGFAVAIGIFVAISFIIGLGTYFVVAGEVENFFVAGRSLPVWIAAFTLGAQSIDANSLLGNADLAYRYHFWDGAVLPLGLGLSLLLNAAFLAHKVHAENAWTLPDIFGKYYGPTVEVLVSVCTIISFLCLLAGNLSGLASIVSYVFGMEEKLAVYASSVVVWAYTVSCGMFSVAYTDVVQGAIGWPGCLALTIYLISQTTPRALPPSVGFPGYVYPDLQGDGGICDMYHGVPCTSNETLCCYNADYLCPSDDDCQLDQGTSPLGDQRIFSDQMTSAHSLTPLPNAIVWNWATLIILGFGNLAALDFQARCMATKTGSAARTACVIGAFATFFVGIPFAYTGAITRLHYGPDSIHAEFDADSCSAPLGLPTCGRWLPDPNAFIKLLTHEAPPILGAWCLCGIVAASMSTVDGAILAMGTVFSHNIIRQVNRLVPGSIADRNLLTVARLSTIPLAGASTLIAAYYRSSHSAGGTGYLLIVTFDVALATVVAPLFGAFYTSKPSPRAALLSILAGASARLTMEFALPKDGNLIAPFVGDAFLDYGSAASANFPLFSDQPNESLWDPETELCEQRRFEDYTGVDSVAAFLLSIVVFVVCQWMEDLSGSPLFSFPGMTPYDKSDESSLKDDIVEDTSFDSTWKSRSSRRQDPNEVDLSVVAPQVKVPTGKGYSCNVVAELVNGVVPPEHFEPDIVSI